MSVQINLIKFVKIVEKKAILSHNTAVTRKDASKEDVLRYISNRNRELVVDGRVVLGEFDISVPISFLDSGVQNIFWRLIEYS